MKKKFNRKKLRKDPRIIKAKQLINETIQDYQNMYINRIESSSKPKKKTLTHYGKLRGNNLFFPYVSSSIGQGSKVLLNDGSVKLDFINGIGAHFGHSLELLRNASIDAAIEDTIMQGNLQQNERSFELMKLLLQESNMDHCILTSSGAMANENALKLLFHNQPTKKRMMAFEKCFMGRTLYLSQLTDKAKYRTGLPQTAHVDYIPFFDRKNSKTSIKSTIDAIHTHVKRYPNQHAGMCMETIQGEGGYNIGQTEFFEKIIHVLKEAEIPILIDEIQTFGRTSELFSAKHFNILEHADIITIGKISQACATIYKSKFTPKPGIISQTYTSSTSAIECGYQIINYLLSNQHFGSDGKNMVLGEYFNKLLSKLSKKYDHISGPYGIGGMIAFTPYNGNQDMVINFLYQLFYNGLMGFITGTNPTRIRFLLPLGSVSKKDIEEATIIIDKTISESC